MSQNVFASKLYYRSCCFVLFFLTAAASFHGYYQKWHFFESGTNTKYAPGSSLDAMVDGTAKRPFVYRQLLPMLADWIDQRVPENVKDSLFAAKTNHGLLLRERLFNSPVSQSRTYFLRYWIVYATTFIFAWSSIYLMYVLCTSVGYAPPTAALSAIIMILLMPYFLTVGGYFYDYPELAFLALAVWMALKFDWWYMIPVVALATWNKESFLLFTPALYPLLRRRSSRISAVVGTGVLGLTCGVVYFVIRSRFQTNPGGTVEVRFMEQIRFLLHPFKILQPDLTYGMPSFSPLLIALILWTLCRGWRSLPLAIQRHAQIAAIINLPLFILFCSPGEWRNLSFLYIPLLLLLATNLSEWAGMQNKISTLPSV